MEAEVKSQTLAGRYCTIDEPKGFAELEVRLVVSEELEILKKSALTVLLVDCSTLHW